MTLSTHCIRIFILVPLLVGGLSACSQESDIENMPDPIRPAKIIEIQDPDDELERVFPGVVISSENTVLSFRVGGRLAKLPVDKKIGALVDSGDLLAALDPTDFKNALATAEASHALAEAQYKRAAQLIDKNFVSATEYDRLRARYRSQKAELSQARTNLAYTQLQAPFQGRIARVMVKNFESVKADQTIAILEDADKVDVVIQVSTSFMAQVPDEAKINYRSGDGGLQIFEIEFENQPGKRYPATVSELETKPDPGTLTYRTVVSMPVPEGAEILAGLNAKVHLNLTRLSAIDPHIQIPVEAVFAPDDQPLDERVAYVWLLNPESMTVSPQRIKIGSITPFGIDVEEGLEPGDRIIGAGVHFLKEGTQVRPLVREEGL